MTSPPNNRPSDPNATPQPAPTHTYLSKFRCLSRRRASSSCSLLRVASALRPSCSRRWSSSSLSFRLCSSNSKRRRSCSTFTSRRRRATSSCRSRSRAATSSWVPMQQVQLSNVSQTSTKIDQHRQKSTKIDQHRHPSECEKQKTENKTLPRAAAGTRPLVLAAAVLLRPA